MKATSEPQSMNESAQPPPRLPVRSRVFAIVNPVAGRSQEFDARRALRERCAEVGCVCEIHDHRGDDAEIGSVVEGACQYGDSVIVAVGGDGTIAAVANALAYVSTPLAIVPLGTANLLARELGIPSDPETACRLAVTGGRVRAIDAMTIDGQVFVCHISLGTTARIAESTGAEAKRRFRRLAYVWNAVRELFGGHTWQLTLNVDGEIHTVRASFVRISNVGAVGAGALRWGPDIQPDDGVVNVCILRALSIVGYWRAFWALLRRSYHRAEHAQFLTAKEFIHVTANRGLPVCGDGERINAPSIRLRIMPRAIKVIVPDEDGVA